MKKLLMAMLMAVTVMALTACAEIPEDVDPDFHTQAMEIFIEVDDDTMELDWEGTDADDQANVNMVVATAMSEREVDFANALENMVALQPKVVDGEKEALKQYLAERTKAMRALNLGDRNETEKFNVPSFQFGEEE
jgi:hypothetical protein